MSYRDTCPQRTVIEVHHTVNTWLPVKLSCGHTDRINWTPRLGDSIGCTVCEDEQRALLRRAFQRELAEDLKREMRRKDLEEDHYFRDME